jgi:hypothetical protein
MTYDAREQRLVAIAMYYFGQRDAGLELRLTDLLQVIPAELHADLNHLIATVNYSRASYPGEAEPWRQPAEVIRQTLQELRERK